MEFFDHVKFLGMYWGDTALQPLISALKIEKAPKIPRGEEDAHVELKKLGLFLIFSDEKSLKYKENIYPEGALVLTNITFYLDRKDGYKPYEGELPIGVSLKAKKGDILKTLGMPSDPKYTAAGKLVPGEDDWLMRWDRKGYTFFCTFSDEGTATDIAIQLPLDQS